MPGGGRRLIRTFLRRLMSFCNARRSAGLLACGWEGGAGRGASEAGRTGAESGVPRPAGVQDAVWSADAFSRDPPARDPCPIPRSAASESLWHWHSPWQAASQQWCVKVCEGPQSLDDSKPRGLKVQGPQLLRAVWRGSAANPASLGGVVQDIPGFRRWRAHKTWNLTWGDSPPPCRDPKAHRSQPKPRMDPAWNMLHHASSSQGLSHLSGPSIT